MKYICLVHHEEGKLAALSQDELDALVGECLAWAEELAKNGHHVLSAGLQGARTATSLRSRNGRMSVTDGPFAETKEILAGFTILEARDLNEAIQLVSRFPATHPGRLEVRPILESLEAASEALDQRIAVAWRRHNDPQSSLVKFFP
jgi:hypothetical protein